MATEIAVPKLGESITEVILLEWLKEDGDWVDVDEPICVLETDKANVELPSPAEGILRTQREVEETLQVGEVVAIVKPGEKNASPPKAASTATLPSPKDTPKGKSEPPPSLSPAVKRLIDEHGLNPDEIKGTGRGSRLVKGDVLAFLEEREKAARPKPQRNVVDMPSAGRKSEVETEPATSDADGSKRVPMSRIRRTIARRLVEVQRNTASLTTFNEIDMTAVIELRRRYKERFDQVHGVPLGLTSFFARACVLALKEFPALSAFIDGDDVVYHTHVNLGIAVSTDHGLVVPVIRNAHTINMAEIETKIRSMAVAVREGRLGIEELSGGTFTITNGGVFGSLLSTPILNSPQSGILGMHTIQKRPVAVDDRVEIRSMMYVALTYDHRIVDGRESVSFLVRVKELIEDPVRLMLEV